MTEPDEGPRYVAEQWRVLGRGPLEIPVAAWFRMRTRAHQTEPAK